MVEQLPFKETVVGSTPTGRTCRFRAFFIGFVLIIGYLSLILVFVDNEPYLVNKLRYNRDWTKSFSQYMNLSSNKIINVALLVGGPSPEHDISLASGQYIENILKNKKQRYCIKTILINRKGEWYRGNYRKSPKEALKDIDVAINALHGLYGEDGKVQSLLNKLRIPYTGSGAVASAIAMDTIASRKLFSHKGFTVPKTIFIHKNEVADYQLLQRNLTHTLGGSFIIKPPHYSWTAEVSLVSHPEQIVPTLQKFFLHTNSLIAEEAISGARVLGGVVATPNGFLPLPPAAIVSFKDEKKLKIVAPAPFGEAINKQVQMIALSAHDVLGLGQYSVTDMIISRDELYVLAVSALPALNENSAFLAMLKAWGMPFEDFLEHIIGAALHEQKKNVMVA